MNRSDFVIFIISHGRPDDNYTYKTLTDAGTKYPIYIVLDNLDKSVDDYKKKFDKILIFDKEKYAKKVDHYDNFWNLRTTTHARNACFDFAESLGFKYFLVLDDDYTKFKFRIDHEHKHPIGRFKIKKYIDRVFNDTLKYFINSNFTSICYSQGGDWFGGDKNFNKPPKRKAMNSFFCSIDRRFCFVSRLNEDVNTYMFLGHQGMVFLTIPFIQLDQMQTQATKGGMTEAYLDGGTYVKSFYTVITRPDCTSINYMGRTQKRLHHSINWENAVPKIIREEHRLQ